MMHSLFEVTRESWSRIGRRGRIALTVYTLSMVITSALDGFGLFLLDSVITSSSDVDAEAFGRSQVVAATAVIGMFLLRSGLAAGLTWFGYSVFAREEVRIGDENLKSYLAMDWEQRSEDNQSNLFSFVDRGPFAMVQQLLLQIGTTAAEVINALVIFVVLVVLDWLTAVVILGFFVLVAMLQHRALSMTMSRSGRLVAEEQNRTYDMLSDTFNLGKLLKINEAPSLVERISHSRKRLAKARAWTMFLESLPRYLMESMLALGVIVIGCSTYFLRGSDQLIPALAVFGVAGFRLLPIVNRIQGLILSFYGREPLVRLGLRETPSTDPSSYISFSEAVDPGPVLKLQSVSFSYVGATTPTLADIDLEFHQGKQYALVGPSGSGKTTLLDLCMGILIPSGGRIAWEHESFQTMAYVPQDTKLVSGSIHENVALNWDTSINWDSMSSALSRASLQDLPDQWLSDIEHSLSGGQRQRLGLARAFYTAPSILFLDEPTSSLDISTEAEIMKAISKLRGEVTTVIIAHRLSTIKGADQIIYLDKGRIQAMGSFETLRRTFPNFERDIELSQV